MELYGVVTMQSTHSYRTGNPRRTVAAIAGALAGGLLLGTAITFASTGGLPRLHWPDGGENGPSLNAIVPAQAVTPLDARSSEGFTVSILGDETKGDSRIISYSVALPSDGFTDMLGIPRFVNPDGSFSLPLEYGIIDAQDADSTRPGLPDGAPSAAIFDARSVQPGAVLRFGPFFRALGDGAAIEGPAQKLRDGLAATIGGEPFIVTLSSLDTGLHEIRFEPQSKAGVVATHPTTRTTVSADGQSLIDVRGSTSFAKTEELDVNANTSTIVVSGEIPEDATVAVAIDSIGVVVKGQWDFNLAP